MGDQEADIDRIKECAGALKRIHDTFEKRANPADGYGMAELGSQRLLDTFSTFGSNWKIHRKKLTEELQSLHGITKAAAEAYETLDHELAEALRRSDKQGSGKPGSGGNPGSGKKAGA
ncbi:hypothetical protein ACFWZ2_23445 [Streptomyces sp. NPDC059002]|uniref:hypothetical protein n=1 Tax=Streptomyces sp. NPDC059002 TaxID=3346690 RepID=UPI003696C7EB